MKNILRIIKKYQIPILLVIVSILAVVIGFMADFGIYAIIVVLIVDVIVLLFPNKRKRRKIGRTKFKPLKPNKRKPLVDRVHPTISEKKYAALKNVKPKDKKKKIDKSSKIDKPKGKKGKAKTVGKVFLMGCFIGTILLFVGFILFCVYIVRNAPDFDPERLISQEASRLFCKDGIEFARLGEQNREKVDFEELPEVLIDAILATEDARFFQHNGFDLPRFMRASVEQLMGRTFAGGASTLTMQVSKNAFTLADGARDANEREGIIRKFTDIYMSIFKIERHLTKEQILELYVNTYLLGGNIYGVEQASLVYFGKHAKDLNLSEAAIIAGMFQSPNRFNPITNPENAARRRGTVLNLMVRHGYITREEADIAGAIPVEDLVRKGPGAGMQEHQAFIDTVVREVMQDTGNNPYVISMDIYTTLDRRAQNVVNNIMNGRNFRWENRDVDAGVAVLDTRTGAIAAIGSGRDTSAAGLFNNATQTNRQIGSTAKPMFSYGPAIEFMNMSPNDIIVDEPWAYTTGQSISNHDGAFMGAMTLTVALGESRNIPALKLFQQLNNNDILKFVTNLGLSPEPFLHEAHSLGGYNGESPLSMSAAYAAFVNGGVYNEPFSYTRIIYRGTNERFDKQRVTRRAMSDITAYMITDMLIQSTNISWGMRTHVRPGVRYAGKTGTSNFSEETKRAHGLSADAINDSWLIGMTNEYTIGLWYGYERINRRNYSRYGNTQSLHLFNALSRGIFTRNIRNTRPSNLVSIQVEFGLGRPFLPSEFTPSSAIRTDFFRRGSEPTEVSPRFARLNNPGNVRGTYEDGTITLTWDRVVPDFMSRAFLENWFRTQGNYSSGIVNSTIAWTNNNLGPVGYDIFLSQDGNLTRLQTTTSTSAQIPVLDDVSSMTFVIRTAHARHKANQSSGATVTVNIY